MVFENLLSDCNALLKNVVRFTFYVINIYQTVYV